MEDYQQDDQWFFANVLSSDSNGGVTYLAANLFSAHKIAIKSCDLNHSSSLVKEYRLLQNFIASPYIVQCLGDFLSLEPDGARQYHMKLELAPEGTIRDLIKKRPGKIPEFEVRHYTHMILQGLQTIHQSGIVHCDLCPQNILLFPRGRFLSRVKIANFGRAKVSGQKYCRNRRLCYRGNVWYMSPESMKVVAENGAVDMIRKPLDIWSLGCTVVEMISGRKAWQLADTDVLMYDFFDEEDLPTLPETMSKKGRDFLRMCFVRDPDKRATASELLCHPYVSEISLPDREEEASLTIGEYAVPFSLPPLGRCFYNLGLDQWRKLHSESDPLQ